MDSLVTLYDGTFFKLKFSYKKKYYIMELGAKIVFFAIYV